MFYPWKALSSWAPFQIDALGLLTLLGANEVDVSVGRLAPSYWLEYMPLLAGFVFAGDRIRTKQPAFTLYNVSSGIVTGNLAAWFTRWMQAQEFEVSRSVVYWEVHKIPHEQPFFVPALISFVFTGFLLVMAMLSADWYGFTNAIAIVILILVRSYMLQSSRNAINRTVSAAMPLPSTFNGALKLWERRNKDSKPEAVRPTEGSRQWRPETAKILIALPDSRLVTMFIPEHLLRGVFITETGVRSPGLYRLAQWAGWLSFTIHVVTLGMAHLATQLYVIGLTVIPTVLICYGFGCDDSRIYKGWQGMWQDTKEPYIYRVGRQLTATILEWPEDVEFGRGHDGKLYRKMNLASPQERRSTARQDLYAWLDLTEEEQKSLWDWHLLPHTRGHDDSWWDDFKEKQRLIHENPPNIAALRHRVQADLNSKRTRKKLFRRRCKHLDDIEKGKLSTPPA
ncbi:hypothetical protein BDW74DRAFT_190268 [Aspergillus multicolor]|uniref:uncharacterized protein n=1 Tax=Aspergillus multicolor TaxID=41759 RepID=UPI003CCD1E7E